MPTLIGPFPRDRNASYDESRAIAAWFDDKPMSRVPVMIDVGAHYGSSLLPFAKLGWEVFAFEPDDENRGRLYERLSREASAFRVQVDARCVGDTPAPKVSFYRSPISSGISAVTAFHHSHTKSQDVEVITLSQFLIERNIKQVNYLKIDTEGSDLYVLRGFPWEVALRPMVILCEYEDRKTRPLGHTWRDIAYYLECRGYVIYLSEWHPVVRYGIRHDFKALKRLPDADVDSNGWGNIIAFRPDLVDEQLLTKCVLTTLKL